MSATGTCPGREAPESLEGGSFVSAEKRGRKSGQVVKGGGVEGSWGQSVRGRGGHVCRAAEGRGGTTASTAGWEGPAAGEESTTPRARGGAWALSSEQREVAWGCPQEAK